MNSRRAAAVNRRLAAQKARLAAGAMTTGLSTRPAPHGGHTPLSSADLTPILLDPLTGERLILDDVQDVMLIDNPGQPACVKLTRVLYKESVPFPWRDRKFNLYLVDSLETLQTWTIGVGIRNAHKHRSRIDAAVTDSLVTERLWLRGDGIVYLDGEPWQRFMKRRFPLHP